MKIKDFVQKLQNLPIAGKKIIFWLTIILVGIILFFFWIKIAKKELGNLDTGKFINQLNLPPIENEFNSLKEGVNELKDEEEWKELEKELTEPELEEIRTN